MSMTSTIANDYRKGYIAANGNRKSCSLLKRASLTCQGWNEHSFWGDSNQSLPQKRHLNEVPFHCVKGNAKFTYVHEVIICGSGCANDDDCEISETCGLDCRCQPKVCDEDRIKPGGKVIGPDVITVIHSDKELQLDALIIRLE